MKKTYLIAVGLVLTLGLAGCGQKAADKAAEKAIEKATGSQVTVDSSTNSVSIITNQGSIQTGDNVSLPPGFPSDIYVIDGRIISAMNLTNGSYTVGIETTKSINEAKAKYETELKNDGWEITMTYSQNNTQSLAAQKNGRMVTVGIYDDSGKTTIALTATEAQPEFQVPE